MKSLWNAAICLCLMFTVVAVVPAQQRKELKDTEKVRRLDVVPEPAPTMHPKFYPGSSFRSLRVPETTFGYVQANGRNFFYEKMGYGPENIIVIHGGPGLPHNYLLPALQNLGPYATLWFYDARGHGLSEQNKPNDPYTMEQLVGDVGAFATAMKMDSYSVFGHSFGGMVALKFAATNPVGLRRLILSDTSASLGYVSRFQDTLKRLMPKDQFAEYERLQSDSSITPDERLRRALRLVYPFYWYNPPKPYYLDLDISSLNLNATASDQIWSSDGQNYDVRKQLSDIKVPTLVINGRYDIVFSYEDAKELSEGIPNARLVILERSGHYPFYEENATFTDWIRTFMQYYAS
ncbi:MAG: alpha/beta hydrolase [Blastocatellia bacterium]|nr:alpha/beta hydrolase [Blastocatellia bacterium]MBK6425144.1 alpha/beta hydrolase [Blastocatellia bacterium]